MATAEQAAALDRLHTLLAEAQRGEADLGQTDLTELSRSLAQGVAGEAELDLLWAAESLQALTRLVEAKMGRQLEDSSDRALAREPLEEEVEDPGQRLAEYRLFKAAAEVLLADASAGPKAFLRVLGLPVQPRASIHLSPESLALALGELLARLPEPAEIELSLPRYSVAEKMDQLRQRLSANRTLRFDQLFTAARDRLEAVALFMALLELLFGGEVSCTQAEPGGPIEVEWARGG